MQQVIPDTISTVLNAGLDWKPIPAQVQPDFLDHQGTPISVTASYQAMSEGRCFEVYGGEGVGIFGPAAGEAIPGIRFYAFRDEHGTLLQSALATQLFDQAELIASNNSFRNEVFGARTQCVPTYSASVGDVITHPKFDPAGDYVVESAASELSDVQFGHYVQRVSARKLADDNTYNPSGQAVEFTLGHNRLFTGRFIDTIEHVLKVGSKTVGFA